LWIHDDHPFAVRRVTWEGITYELRHQTPQFLTGAGPPHAKRSLGIGQLLFPQHVNECLTLNASYWVRRQEDEIKPVRHLIDAIFDRDARHGLPPDV
jgi:hypothetical protein